MNERKYLPIIYPMRSKYCKYIKSSYNSIAKKKKSKLQFKYGQRI